MTKKNLVRVAVLCLVASAPLFAFGSVESSLSAVQEKLVGTILPLAAILGFVFAGFSYISGNPNSRSHLVRAIKTTRQSQKQRAVRSPQGKERPREQDFSWSFKTSNRDE